MKPPTVRVTVEVGDETLAVLDRLAEAILRLDRLDHLAAARPVPPEDPAPGLLVPLPPEMCAPPEMVSDPDTAADVLADFEPVKMEDLAHMPEFKGRSSVQKGAIWGRMKRYRISHGLGCWAALAEALGKSDDWVRSVYAGEIAVPLDIWRKIDQALEKLEGGQYDE